ncbi:hypothetical protein SmJEL517_g06246 [Synchytrium microbalum]|uniref:Phosphatidylglycerol/phosphatidylinositol transfer protein n=1 Tax=Synchytrium microbalum TaxID=1806994 RepID=A0A507BXV2_9FUNG|nr:uncharacterized protein SmJEL517_g06246 [Synchytrium microbalum]TPX30113.1 hypothetical protein SmJEL517_g06246 [Synchytrium microbalum]
MIKTPLIVFIVLAATAHALWLPSNHDRQIPIIHTMATTTLCGTDDDIFTVESIILTPDPPVKGQSLVIEARGYLKEDVVAGSVADVKVKLGLIKLFEQRLDLCEEIKRIDVECPILKGYQVIERTIDLPNELPAGKYNLHLNATNADDLPITCVNAEFRF